MSARAAVLAAAAVLAVALLISLGFWQVHRLGWKQDLIRRVDLRVSAAPVPAPGPAAWAAVNAKDYEYLRVRVRGRFLNERETLVQAVTKLGSGFWVVTPFEVEEGYTTLINRGFVPSSLRVAMNRLQGQIDGETVVTGLLRMSEPGGGFLRANDRSADRWYSRDVAAISAARGLPIAAPYFIDSDAVAPAVAGAPVGGLTVVVFPNNHLSYALTWFTLALMLAGWTLRLFFLLGPRGKSADCAVSIPSHVDSARRGSPPTKGVRAGCARIARTTYCTIAKTGLRS